MAFNEQNSVEHLIVHHLEGINLNSLRSSIVREDAGPFCDDIKWQYVQADLLRRRNLEKPFC